MDISFVHFGYFQLKNNFSLIYDKEAELYIANIRDKFGSFCFAEQRTTINPGMLSKYISDMTSAKRCRNAQTNSSIEQPESGGVDRNTNPDDQAAFEDLASEPASKASKMMLVSNAIKELQMEISELDDDESQSDAALCASMDDQSKSTNVDEDDSDDEVQELQIIFNNAHKSHLNALKTAISNLKLAHANEIAALNDAHCQKLDDAKHEIEITRDRLENQVKENERLRVEIECEKQRAQKYSKKLKKVRKLTKDDITVAKK